MSTIFDTLKDVRPTAGGSYFEPDHDFLVFINVVKKVDIRAHNDGAFIVECVVLKSSLESIRAGADRNWYVDLKVPAKKGETSPAAGNLKQFGMAAGQVLLGEPVELDTVDGAFLLDLCATPQPLAGKVMRTVTHNHLTAKGNNFTRHIWYAPTPDQTAEGEKIALSLGLVLS